MNLRLPPKLHPGDTVAIVSLSAGTAGDAHFKWRTEQGIQRLLRRNIRFASKSDGSCTERK